MGLRAAVRTVTLNLNRIIDGNFYPTDKTQRSNLRHRPIGVGVQGLADVFMMLDLPFLSVEARRLNRDIFETIYHACLSQSCDLAKIEGPYASFKGSPASEGRLQFDLWAEAEAGDHTSGGGGGGSGGGGGTTCNDAVPSKWYAEPCDWTALKEQISTYGLRNSLLVAPMPTASTSQIMGYTECFEPITSNIYSRRTLAGEFIVVNKYLMRDLLARNLWTEQLKNQIILHNGSVQHIDALDAHLKEKYRTVWELPMRGIIDMAADRGRFVDQSQSMNLWLEDPSYSALTSMHFYAWSRGLKTGMYYLRRRARYQAQKFSVQVVAEEGGGGGATGLSPPPQPPVPVPANDEQSCESCSA